MIGKKSKRPEIEEKILDVDANMQGNLIFKDPVNLKINGSFEGNLTTKGSLTIGEHSEVTGDIIGEAIVVAGRVSGDIIAQKSLKIMPPASVIGDVETPSLSISEGAVLHGNCRMVFDEAQLQATRKNVLTLEEAASYLEVDPSVVNGWADSGRLKGRRENNGWRFDRAIVDEWIRTEKIR